MTQDRRSWSAHKELSRGRLGGLIRFVIEQFGIRNAGATGPVATDPPNSVMRRLYDDIGHFLFSHQLDLTPLNFGCAHDYVAGGDCRMTDDVDCAIRERKLSNGWIEDYLARQDSNIITGDALHEMTSCLEKELGGVDKLPVLGEQVALRLID